MKGTKHDKEKVRVDLLPVVALETIAAVFTHGAKKYGEGNWQKGIDEKRLYAATLRHMFAHKKGELYDDESSILHLAHAACNLLMMIELREQNANREKARNSSSPDNKHKKTKLPRVRRNKGEM